MVAPVGQRENYHYHGQAQPAATIANPPPPLRTRMRAEWFGSKSAPPPNKQSTDPKSSSHDERKNEPSDFFRTDSRFRTSVVRHLLTWLNEAGRR